MSSRREEERNEKIIRGLMKLPPNRRCINCNSLGPQYVCTSFWTFICITCSGIHREFTHRVKSVSMAKFTSQEVDALQKGGNQRARELFLKAWDPSNRLPDNSNVEKVREFIKSVYVNKKYSNETSSNKPPRDPQSLRSQEDETRRASSYHSYSQSPPYDFQYEERRYGKHAPVLTRKPGSDRGHYEGKLASFLSPTHLSDDGFANEGSNPRVSDFSVSGGGDPFRSRALSPVSQRDFGSPSSETSGDISGEVPHSSENIRRNAGKAFHPQRTASTGSFGSIDSNFTSFKSINSLPEAGTGPEHSAEVSLEKSLSLPSLPPSSMAQTFNDLDLFSAPFVPNTINTDLQSTQQSSQIPQTQPLDLFAALSQQHPSASLNEKASDVEAPNNGRWATFDVPKNVVPIGSENSAPPAMSSSDGNVFGNFNPFTIDESLHQNPTNQDPFVPTNAFVHGSLQSVPAAVNQTDLWNAFGDSTGEQLNTKFVESNEQDAVHRTPDTDKSFGFGTHEVDTSIVNQLMTNDSSFRTTNEAQPPPSSLSSHFNIKPNDFPMVSAVGQTHSFASDLKPTNPFNMPFDSDVETSNMGQTYSFASDLKPTNPFDMPFDSDVSQVWDVSSLQGALPTATQMPPVSNVEVNESWFTENSIPSYAPVSGGVPFDSTSASLGFMAGQAPYTQIP